MKKAKSPAWRPFADVSMDRELPVQHLADHEVFMSFTNDEDAIKFTEWWNVEGAIQFNRYLELNQDQA